MNKSVRRRAATAAAALAATLGGLLLAGGSASAAPVQAAHHAAAVAVSPAAFQVHGHDGERLDRFDRFDRYGSGQASRWDGHRSWERQGGSWYSNDRGHQYRYDGHQFYRWNNGWQIIQVIDVYGFNPHLFR